MADFIFTHGTCAKKDMHKTIVNLLKGAGWVDISSLPTTDFIVLNSKGVNGDKNLIWQTRPTNSSGVNSVETTDYSFFSHRFIGDYTPGASGVAGTSSRNSLGWGGLSIIQEAATSATVTKDATMDYWYNVDLNGITILMIPPSQFSLPPVLLSIRDHINSYAKCSNSRGLTAAHTSTAVLSAGAVGITDTPDGVTSQTSPYNLATYAQLAPKNPNVNGVYCISETFFGNGTEGTRGKLDGIYSMPASGIIDGDILTIGSAQYRACIGNGGSLPTTGFAIRIA